MARQERSTAAGGPPRGSETILLVEDQESIRELVEEFLESSGYRVVSAQDGAEALEIMESQKHAIDLLLTDIVMPKVSGPELSRRLASLLPKLKVLYISGYAEHSPANTEIVQGSAICLQKPFALEALHRQIRSLLDSESSQVIPTRRQ